MMAPFSKIVAACVASLSGAYAVFQNGSIIAPCDSELYCYGPILNAIQLAAPFDDSKTFVDMPTKVPLVEIEAAFETLAKPLTNTTQLNEFLDTYFDMAGGELSQVPADSLTSDPVFLENFNDTVIREFVEKVIDIWPDLTRKFNANNCTECVSSFIPVNRTFVVAGGRFREAYYWDSFFTMEGLLRTGGSFVEISRNIIENFLDLIQELGFVPNGSRVYYKNRSQPPLLTQMVRIYIEHTNDTTILERAIPGLIQEYEFFMTNRTVNVTINSTTYQLNQYNVNNNQPRPESYLEDWQQANNESFYSTNGSILPAQPLNESEKGLQYKNLATGAESGWDYSSRYLRTPLDAANGDTFPLRSLNVINLVTVELNSILYWNEVTIGGFLKQIGNETDAECWADRAKTRSEAMYAVMWNETFKSYFDYNITSNAQNTFIAADVNATAADMEGAPEGQQVLFTPAHFYPFWTGAAPSWLKNNPAKLEEIYGRVALFLDERPGAVAATNFESGQQWDQPNVWPPLVQVLIEGMLNTPPFFGEDDPSWINLQALALKLGQRYLDSAFCTWYSTGGSTSATPQLSGVTPGSNGTMFEKYSDAVIDEAGGGGEYEVVAGFGWSNGVLIWVAETFGNKLQRPDCGNITGATVTTPLAKLRMSALAISPNDAKKIKKFKRSRTSL